MYKLPFLVILLVCGVSTASVNRTNQGQGIQLCPTEAPTAPRVDVTLYYESLCGGCVSSFTPLYNAAGYIMDLTLLPFGNAKEEKQGDKYFFTCQHGVPECEGNMVETCVLHYYPNMQQAINFITCFEIDFADGNSPVWQDSLKKCAQPYGVDEQTISTCVTGDEGWELQHEVAVKTGKHQYVPWVIINGKHEADYENNPAKYICEAYTGPTPDYCKQF